MKRPDILKTSISTKEISYKWILSVEVQHAAPCANHTYTSYDPYEEVAFMELFTLGGKHWEEWSLETQAIFNEIWEAMSTGWGERDQSLEDAEKFFPLNKFLQAFTEALKNETLKEREEDKFWRSREIVKLIQDHPGCNENVRLTVIWGW